MNKVLAEHAAIFGMTVDALVRMCLTIGCKVNTPRGEAVIESYVDRKYTRKNGQITLKGAFGYITLSADACYLNVS